MIYYKIAKLVSYMEEKRQKGDLEEAKRIATILDEKYNIKSTILDLDAPLIEHASGRRDFAQERLNAYVRHLVKEARKKTNKSN
jgi:hypothetical protein